MTLIGFVVFFVLPFLGLWHYVIGPWAREENGDDR